MPTLEELAWAQDPYVDPEVTDQWTEVIAAYRRSGGLCGICHESVDLTVRSGRAQPTIDHIVPKSKGWSDERSNLQLAHRGCNSQKGNR